MEEAVALGLPVQLLHGMCPTYRFRALPAFVWAGVEGLGLNAGPIELSTRCAGSG